MPSNPPSGADVPPVEEPDSSISKEADRGEAPATEPGAIRRESDHSTLATGSDETRREARRHKRQAAREKFHRASVQSTTSTNRSSTASAATIPSAATSEAGNFNEDDDEDDDEDYETPGSFAVVSKARRSQQIQDKLNSRGVFGDSDDEDGPLVEDAKNAPVTEKGGDEDGAVNKSMESEDNPDKNLPVAVEAEVVPNYHSYPGQPPDAPVFVATAKADNDDRVVPLKWIMVVGCIIAALIIGIAVGLGVGLSGGGDNGQPSAATGPQPPTFQPVEAPTFQPVVPPTFPPVEPGEPTFAPVVPPTFPPVVPPTFEPVVPPTSAPVVQPTPAPVEAPTFAPVEAPVVVPTAPPVPAPTPAPVEEVQPTGGGSDLFPIYSGRNGLSCQCRYYSQDLIITDASDFNTLPQSGLSTFLQYLIGLIPSFDPFGFRRKLRGRALQPSSFAFSMDLDSQSRFGNPSGGDFGLRMVYLYEFCVDDAPFVEDYHEAFASYMQNAGNRDAMANELSGSLGMPSLTEVSVPDQLDRVCDGSR